MRRNEDENIEGLVQAWTVETVDLTSRVRAEIGAITPISELISMIQALRGELNELRRTTEILQDEVFRLKLGSTTPSRSGTLRFAPYSPTESLASLS